MRPGRKPQETKATLLEKRAWVVALGLVALGFLLRLPGVFEWWLNPDEGIYFSMMTWRNSARFWVEMAENAHPPLYYLVTRLLGLVTRDFAAIRALSLVAGSAAIYAAWLVGREIAFPNRSSSLTGLLSALLVALSPGAIVMSQLIRPYMMQLAFLLFTLFHLLRFRRERHASHLIWYSILLSLSLLIHYSSFLAFGVFGILILSDFATGTMRRQDVPRLLAAHVVPVLVCSGLYIFHLKAHVLGSVMADEALNSWLAPFMIHSFGDVWARLLGFMGFLIGTRLAGPAALLWLASLALATKRRSWSLLVISLASSGIAVFVASTGHYPFGASRHCSWLIGFFTLPLAWGLAQAVSFRNRTRVIVVGSILLSFVFGDTVGRLLGTERTQTLPPVEQVLKRTDLATFSPMLTSNSGPRIVLMNTQSYYLLLPLFVEDRETIEQSEDGSFSYFQLGSRTIIVTRSWEFSVRPDEIGEPNHLFTFVQNVDMLMPQFQLGKQDQVLMIFGGWSDQTALHLMRADESLPQGSRLVERHKSVPGLTALTVDIARYRRVMIESLDRKAR